VVPRLPARDYVDKIETMGRDRMGPTTPDLFSTGRERSSPQVSSPPLPPASIGNVRHVLPKDLPNAMKGLSDAELDKLVAAASAEQQRRGRKPAVSDKSARRPRVDELPLALTSGKLNAVRAAFKAGISPSRIARQFGISQSGVRKALTGDAPDRK
jgi:hypothetical protein